MVEINFQDDQISFNIIPIYINNNVPNILLRMKIRNMAYIKVLLKIIKYKKGLIKFI
ncbi:hypothetical protein CLCOS_13230 [Clostridium coskatii]|uniref:Uncharacterized protein n=1 Tax=Clostridium coskatii TaxID=1705578 RepID=A0A170NNX5_9CLOT|nr:hypothetical protein WX73_03347 [Clostridium coskatii]OBR95530.1 hypothetical protein CLCOS_13230 [Clostridium coskatii]